VARTLSTIVVACTACAISACASVGGAIDAQTRAWWQTTEALSSDAMEGRDTGSPGYDRAAAYVAERFAAAGLQPAGDNGTYLQSIAFKDIEVVADGTTIAIVYPYASGQTRQLRFLHDISVTPAWGMSERLEGEISFRGYCAPDDLDGVRGQIVICLGARRTGQTTAASRLQAATAAGAIGIINVDDISFTQEPPRWPLAYARTVALADAPRPPASIPVLRMSAAAFTELANANGVNAERMFEHAARNAPLMSFHPMARLDAHFATRERSYSSANVLALMPGTDPALADEPVLLIAHLDGYGYGTPVHGDNLYNGALDDAAYVATLITFADARRGQGFRRPLIFAAVTGEEKGLHGSRWLAGHPTPAAPTPIAVLNLDQLRPLYPLRILTTLALDDSTLGQTVRDIAEPMGIEVRPDLEPERNLLRRTDHWPFMQRGVPAVSFLFGFDQSDTVAAARYRDWYENRYHAPQDDMTTPIDFEAQAQFHRFYFALAEVVANADGTPQWLPNSPNRPAAVN
jgi:hypothetical protein